MAKPHTLAGYSEQVTRDCERVLVTLLRNLGPHKEPLVLIGGLTPRYLVPERPPLVPQHAGTLDLDVVIDLVVLEDTDAYRTLEENLKKIGFERGENDKGEKVNWKWPFEGCAPARSRAVDFQGIVDREDYPEHSSESEALVHAHHGAGDGRIEGHGISHLAGERPQAAPRGELQG
jgi:hypothetical protein